MEQPVSSPSILPPSPGGERAPMQPVMQAAVSRAEAPGAPRVTGGERTPGGEIPSPSVPTGGQPYIPPVAPPPQMQQVAQADPQGPQDNKAVPVVADDVDVIEKEWVDKAKQIVAATHDDPHAQELQVSELQSDYLKKRYGKEISIPKD